MPRPSLRSERATPISFPYQLFDTPDLPPFGFRDKLGSGNGGENSPQPTGFLVDTLEKHSIHESLGRRKWWA